MKLNFIKLRMMDADTGKEGSFYWAVPEQIRGVATVLVPSPLVDGGKQAIHVQKGALDLGMRLVPINMTPDQLVKKLEEWNTGGDGTCPMCDDNGYYKPPEEDVGYEFQGLEPNQTTIDTLEKSERGEDLHSFNTVEELFEDLEKRNISGEDEERKLFYESMIMNSPEELAQVCIGDWVEGIGDVLSLYEAKFIRKCSSLLVKIKSWKDTAKGDSEPK